MQRLRLVHRSLRLRRHNAAPRNQSSLRLRPLQRKSRRPPMHQMVPRRSPDIGYERRVGSESKNQRNQETLPSSNRKNKLSFKKSAIFFCPLSFFHSNWEPPQLSRWQLVFAKTINNENQTVSNIN